MDDYDHDRDLNTAPILHGGRHDDNNSHEEQNGQCTCSMLNEVNGGNNGRISFNNGNDEINDGNGSGAEEEEVAGIASNGWKRKRY